ncbi:MAG: prolyl oligopeptidase family serine peptidase [Planctomycetaceae bacterium]|nr:prolyl oligopeptidase family serine peptidase [Planctomycetaceae bacterium]
MRGLIILLVLSVCHSLTQAQSSPTGNLVQLRIETKLVPSPAVVDVLLPPDYEQLSEPVPLLVWLHGGTSGKDALQRQLRSHIERAWETGEMVPCVVVAPVTGASFFIDWHDGTNRWDTFITTEMLGHIREQYNVKQDRAGTVIAGSSFGGQGVLRVALKHPELFIAAASMAPGFTPVLKLEDWDIRYFGDDVLADNARRFGEPVDHTFWRSTHPPTMVIDNAARLRESGLQLLIEVGDEDANGNFRSVELLHRLLFDAAIPHDYHLHRGAAHVGRSKDWRFPEVFLFLSRELNPPPEPDPAAEQHKLKAIQSGRYQPLTTNELPKTLVEFPCPD